MTLLLNSKQGSNSGANLHQLIFWLLIPVATEKQTIQERIMNNLMKKNENDPCDESMRVRLFSAPFYME